MSAQPARPAPPLAVLERPEQVAAMLRPPRLAILEHLREPDSAAGLARRRGVPRQRLNHHLRELERAGLVELVEERRKGNCMERVVRARAEYFLIGPQALGAVAGDRPEALRDRFSWAYLVAAAARAVRELTVLRRGADEAGKQLPTFTLETRVHCAGPEALHAFTEELSNEVARLVAKHHDEDAPGGRTFSFLLGAYPTPAPAADDADGGAADRVTAKPRSRSARAARKPKTEKTDKEESR